MMSSPSNDLNVQLPGRLIALEILVVLLLRQKPDAERMMREANAMLQAIETQLHEAGDEFSEHARQVLSAARAALDKLSAEAIRRPSARADLARERRENWNK
jgi:uncharacterized membrane protein YgaE (UPF0421/DUF939 family)